MGIAVSSGNNVKVSTIRAVGAKLQVSDLSVAGRMLAEFSITLLSATLDLRPVAHDKNLLFVRRADSFLLAGRLAQRLARLVYTE
jgi:hypothetical protein